MDAAIYQKTLDECNRGWARRSSKAELDSKYGPLWLPARRFGVEQGGDYRPIDDFSEFGVNDTSSTKESVDVGGVDDIVGLAKAWIEAVDPVTRAVRVELSSGRALRGELHPEWSLEEVRDLRGRSVDLEKAFKQIARSPAHGALSIIAVWNPEAKHVEFFETFVLPFGARNSVFGFNWLARALCRIVVSSLGVVCTHYFDDFPIVEPKALNRSAENAVIKTVDEVLGWRLKKEGDKAKGFEQSFTSLGVVVDFTNLLDKLQIEVRNKESRWRDIDSLLREVERCGVLRPGLVASLRGRLQFTTAQCFGRCGALGLRLLGELEKGGAHRVTEPKVKEAFAFWRQYFTVAKPRTIDLGASKEPVLIFSDGACEGEGFSIVTIGAVVFVPGNPHPKFFGMRVPDKVVKVWAGSGQRQTIGQAEIAPALIARLT